MQLPVIVMPANNSSGRVHYLAGKHGGLGHLYSPGGERGPYPWLPYALDNGAYAAWKTGSAWDEAAFFRLLDWAGEKSQKPLWVVAPDVVTDAVETLRVFDFWRETIEARGFVAALAAQDGMSVADVTAVAPEVLFLGGTLDWKWRWLGEIAGKHERIHVGRVNRPEWLWRCRELGVESVDGTGWFRGDQNQLRGLEHFLREQGNGRPQRVFPWGAS